MGRRATGFNPLRFFAVSFDMTVKIGQLRPSYKSIEKPALTERTLADLKGLKRICMSCGARFYDLNKKPIICPGCATEFTGEIKVKSRRGRLPAEIAESQVDETAAEDVNEEAETEEVESDEETVSLEEIDEDSDDEDEDDLELDDENLDLDDEGLDDEDLDDDIDEDIAEEDEDK